MNSIGTFGSYTQARLAIYASQAGLSVTGNNIANINTFGYTRQRLEQSSFYAGGADRYYSSFGARTGNGVLCTGVSQLRDPYLDIRYRSQMSNVGAMDAKLGGLEGIQAILDEVSDGEDGFGIISAQLDKMYDALQQLTANGASPNAFTSNAITGYYFESTEHFEENLRTLLSFVSVPYFTRESVEKERGIIGQEIGMIEDDPNWTVFVNLLGALYEHHPIRTSVAGTVESISHITEETLYACHKAFYDPANMVLCAAGDLDPQAVCRLAREVLPTQAGPIAEKDYGPEEPSRAARGLVEEHMAVSCPIFQLGCKGDAPERGEAGLRQELLGDLACEVLLGTSTPLYARLYRDGLLNRGFSYGYDSVPGAAFLVAGGESRDPEAVRDAVAAEAARIAREGVDPALWERIKKGVYGSRVRSLNSFETLCIGQAQSFFAGSDLLRFPEMFRQITREDVEALIARWVIPERLALSVVRPGEEALA